MGSSPFTATISSFLSDAVPSGGRILVAFSGGIDSSALLAALCATARRFSVEVIAAHLDHALDDQSAQRRRRACDLAARIGAPLISERLDRRPPAGASLEEWAREQRYAFLDRWADVFDAERIVTAHHADDQAETVLLRWLYGSGIEGLRGIRPLRGRLARPLLEHSRDELRAFVDALGIEPIEDPTNRDLARPRNLLRRCVLPDWRREIPDLTPRLCGLARAASAATRRLDDFFEQTLRPRSLRFTDGVVVDRRALTSLPQNLHDPALKWLHRRAGAPRPASAAARSELLRQFAQGIDSAGCDAGRGFRWECDASNLCLLLGSESPTGNFAYTLAAGSLRHGPVEIELPGFGRRSQRIKIRLQSVRQPRDADAERRVERPIAENPDRAFLVGLSSARRIEVRNRRPGDRLIPFGKRHRRKLKDLFIDLRIPRHARDRLPLLVVDDQIAWAPGITIDERFRLGENDEDVWLAELLVERERPEP